MPDRTATPRAATPARYRITIEGELDPDWGAWLDGLAIVGSHRGPDSTHTALESDRLDQPGLRGALGRIWDLNLVLVAVARLTEHDGGRP